MKLLIIEDEAKMAGLLRRGLSEEGHLVDACRLGAEALELTRQVSYDALLLDWMLPDTDGLAVLRAIRGRGQTTPVIFVTARGTVGERVAALRAGADDYLVKPFDFEELLARVEAVHRRVAAGQGRHTLGPVVLDTRRRALIGVGREVALTPRELGVLAHLAEHVGETIPRGELLRNVWGLDIAVEPNVVDVYVGYLRNKLRQAQADGVRIESVRAVGYRLVVAHEVVAAS
ncbi:MAG: response regulator transcription factor [Myxococcota bacterium]